MRRRCDEKPYSELRNWSGKTRRRSDWALWRAITLSFVGVVESAASPPEGTRYAQRPDRYGSADSALSEVWKIEGRSPARGPHPPWRPLLRLQGLWPHVRREGQPKDKPRAMNRSGLTQTWPLSVPRRHKREGDAQTGPSEAVPDYTGTACGHLACGHLFAARVKERDGSRVWLDTFCFERPDDPSWA